MYLSTFIMTFKAPALSFIPESQDEGLIRSAFEMLRSWNHIPFIDRGIKRMSRIMERSGISTDIVASGH